MPDATSESPAPEPRASRALSLALDGLVVAATSTAHLLGYGYKIGCDDHFIHLVFLARARSADALPQDLLADAAVHHPSFFWRVQVPLVGWFGVEATYFALHVLSLVLFMSGVLALTRALAPAPLAKAAGWLACLLAVPTVLCFGAIPTFDTLMLNRTIVLGPELIALALAIRGRVFAGAFLIGLMANLHATTAAHTAAVAFAIAAIGPNGLRSIPALLGGLAAGALPLAWTVQRGAPAHSGGAPADVFESVTRSWPFHHLVDWMNVDVFAGLIVPACAVAVFARRRGPWLAVLVAVLSMCALNFVAIDLLHVHQVLGLHLYESGRLLTCVGFAATSVLVLRAASEGGATRRWATGGLMAAHLLLMHAQLGGSPGWVPIAIAPISAAVLLHQDRARRPDERALGRSLPAWAFVCAAAALLGLVRLLQFPGAASISARMNDTDRILGNCRSDFGAKPDGLPVSELCGFDAMGWAAKNLGKDALVAIPPLLSHPLVGFRIRTGIRAYVTFKDGGEGTFDPAFAAEWLRRLDAVAGPLPPIPPRAARSTAMWWEHIYRELPARYYDSGPERFLKLRDQESVTHAVCERTARCGGPGFRVVYEDAAYRIIDLRDVTPR